MDLEKVEEFCKRVKTLMLELNNKQIDREELIQLLVLSLFSLKHIFLLGEPGVSKTGILEIFSSAIDTSNSFSICIKHDTKYEEIFGDRYRDESGKMFYDSTNSIVEAHFAIIDETWKGNSKVMNSLLSIMSNYRNIDIMGKGSVEVPLLMVGGASNELPSDKEVRPLRDRFLFSYRVQKIVGEEHWIKFASRNYDRDPKLNTKFTPSEIREINELSKNVTIPEHIYNTLYKIRQKVVLLEIGVSERKFDGAIDVFLVSAFLNNRKEVDLSELFLMRHMMWEEEKDIPLIDKILNDEIFGQLDQVIKYVESIENNYKRLLSILDGSLSDFLKFRKIFPYRDMYKFDEQKSNIQTMVDEFSLLVDQTKSVISHYNSSVELEKKIVANILVSNKVSPVYQGIDYATIPSLYAEITNRKEMLEEWLSANGELYSYNMMVNNVYHLR